MSQVVEFPQFAEEKRDTVPYLRRYGEQVMDEKGANNKKH
jgi:hypothetical protein